MPMTISPETLQKIIEAALMVAGRPLPINHIQRLFEENEQPSSAEIRASLDALMERYKDSGISLREVASGFQFQAHSELSSWLCKLWDERPARYSRALLETLALIAYRQPITRAEIEEIRGVTVSSHIIKTLLEREWIKVIGYREVVGKPALYGTTKIFLDHFNLKSLDELPTLAELKDLESQEAKLQVQLELPNPELAIGENIQDANEEYTNIEHGNTIDEKTLDESIEYNTPVNEPHEIVHSSESYTSDSETHEIVHSSSESHTSDSETHEIVHSSSESHTSDSETHEIVHSSSESHTSDSETHEIVHSSSESHTSENETQEIVHPSESHTSSQEVEK